MLPCPAVLLSRFELSREPLCSHDGYDLYQWSKVLEPHANPTVGATVVRSRVGVLKVLTTTTSEHARSVRPCAPFLTLLSWWCARSRSCRMRGNTHARASSIDTSRFLVQVPLLATSVSLVHPHLDWTDLLWDETGVRVKGVHYSLVTMRYVDNIPVPLGTDEAGAV